MIKYVKVATNKVKEVRPVDFSIDGVIKYIGQSGTSGYGGQVDFLKSHYNGLVKYKIDKVIGMDKFSTNYSVDQDVVF
jgi:hypothetical protein